MAGIDDHVAVIGDWMPANPSHRTFFSTNLVDNFNPKSFPPILGDDQLEDSVTESSQKLKAATDLEEGTENSISDKHLSDLSLFSSQKSSCLAERVAARAGFNAPKLNTTRVGPATLSSSEVRSPPYLMLSPGLSPTVLLDSPVFLSNSMVQPSPTTGKFVTSCSNLRSSAVTEAQERDKDDLFENVDDLSFAFKPHVESSSSYAHSAVNKVTSEDVEFRGQNRKGFHVFDDFFTSSVGKDNDASLEHKEFDNVIAKADNSAPLDDQQDEEGEDQRSPGELNTTIVNGTPSEDGYNWRKYGQKHVKGSECPRSYYKCTHPNCQVKKKVERSREGHIIEIVYKGAHNHPKPPANRRFIAGSSNLQSDWQLDTPEHLEHAGAQAFADVEMAWENSNRDAATGAHDWAHDIHEATSPVSDGHESCDPSTSMLPQKGPPYEVAASGIDVPLNLSNDEEDMGPHGSASLVYDGEDDESESKRRKIDAVEMGGASRAIREPRVVVQTTSEVDILDDGYRWRKYGQKVVKGNPNPRSYYKCTNAGCTVRKHVERASHDLKSVITTYEGKHNHDVPAARNSSLASSGPSTMVQSSVSQCHVQRPEASHVPDNVGSIDGPALLGKLGLHGRQQVGHSPGFSFHMNQPALANLTMASLRPNAGQPQTRLPTLPINPYLAQQHQVNEVGFMALKEEPRSEIGLNLSNRPSLYGQMMNRLPL